MNKVFCNDCKHMRYDAATCRKHCDVFCSPFHIIRVYRLCSDKNSNNCCKKYEPNWRKIVSNYFKYHHTETVSEEVDMCAERIKKLKNVLEELDECAEYWSEYDVPIGIHDRIKAALRDVE